MDKSSGCCEHTCQEDKVKHDRDDDDQYCPPGCHLLILPDTDDDQDQIPDAPDDRSKWDPPYEQDGCHCIHQRLYRLDQSLLTAKQENENMVLKPAEEDTKEPHHEEEEREDQDEGRQEGLEGDQKTGAATPENP